MAIRFYLIIFRKYKARAHWALWFPSQACETKGKMLHISGTPYTGYFHHAKFNLDLLMTRKPPIMYLLGQTDSANVIYDDDGVYKESFDLNVADSFEACALGIPAPGPITKQVPQELCPVGPPSVVNAALANDIPGFRCCQEWLMELIAESVNRGLLPTTALAKAYEAWNARQSFMG